MAYNSGTDPTLAELITAKFLPEKFSQDVIFHTMSNLVVASRVNTSYRSDLKNGYKVSIPVLSEVTDTEVTPGTVPTARDAAGTPVSITVNHWREASVEISDMANIENHAEYLSIAAKSCAYRIAKRVDTTLGALFSTLNSSSVYGSDGQTLTDDIILALMETLDEGDVPEDDRSIITDPSSKVDLLKIDKFVRNDYVREPVIATGKFGNIYNMGVYITNNLTATTTGNYGVMMHRDALGLVIQKNPRSQMVRIPQEFRTLAIVDVIFGVAELRDTFGYSFYTRSS
tara:strand:- start:586 stop:1443 length:858 start_codon:yes stop_codon:yes gene_type:complete